MTDIVREQVLTYGRAHHDRFLDEFKLLLSIPSISTDPAHRADVQRAADWLVTEMTRIGLDHCRAMPSDGHPVVYGDWLHAGDDAPTVLVYAHYDVQPVDPLHLWTTPPFEPTIRDGRLFARGTIDDKCGVFLNLKAVESMLATTGTLPVNVKFFFEGEEESGSPSMEPFVKAHKEQLDADLMVICDGGATDDRPTIFTSLRGLVAAEVTVDGPRRDLHSGSYGGVVLNPAHVAARIIAAAHDDDGHIQIPGFYDDVRPLDAAQLALIAAVEDASIARAQRATGRESVWGERDFTFLHRKTGRPTFDVGGITCGYQGPGVKTIIPAQARFKVTMRLVADQDPLDIVAKFQTWVDGFAVDGVDISVNYPSTCRPVELGVEGPAITAVRRAYDATWPEPAELRREGGSVPIVGMFAHELGFPITGMGLGKGDNGHSPNEYYELSAFGRNLATAVHFYYNVAEEMGK